MLCHVIVHHFIMAYHVLFVAYASYVCALYLLWLLFVWLLLWIDAEQGGYYPDPSYSTLFRIDPEQKGYQKASEYYPELDYFTPEISGKHSLRVFTLIAHIPLSLFLHRCVVIPN
jgi:hypothetical protein